MMEDVNKLLDVIENLVAKVDTNDPKDADALIAFAARLESIAMELHDRTDKV